MAIVGHSYFYHTRKDTIAQIEPGSSQHFANNIMAVLEHLLGPSSPLVSEKEFHPPDMVYIGLYDRVYVYWSMKTADGAYVAVAAVVAAVVRPFTRRNAKTVCAAMGGAVGGLVAGLVAANGLAAALSALERKQLW
jgi:hypothetical protein